MKLEILKFPDPRLKLVAKPVKKITPELVQLSKDMLETMYESRGIGLAATQVGQAVRLLVIDTRPRDLSGRYEIKELTELEKKVGQPLILFNPQVLRKEGHTTFEEGCLSVPTFYETVERAEVIEVCGLNAQGEEVRFLTDGLLAICVQHEIDHLDGKLFIDRLSLIKSNRIKNKIKKYGYPTKKEEAEEPMTELETDDVKL